MNDEIKEILDYLKESAIKKNLYFEIKPEKAQILLDYITNLQQKIEQYENPDDMTLFYMWLDVKAKDKMKELQQENEELKKKLDRRYYKNEYERIKQENERLKMQLKKDNHILGCNFASKDKYKKKYEDYKSRCEKAIEFLNNIDCMDFTPLIKILEGKNE